MGAPKIALKITPCLKMVTLSLELKLQRKLTIVLNNVSFLKIAWSNADGALSIP